MAISRNLQRLSELFLKSGLVDELQMRSAIAHLEQWGGRLPKALVERGFVDEETVTEELGKGLKMTVTHLGTVAKDVGALARLDVRFCEEKGVFPISLKDRVMILAMADPTELDTIDTVQARVGARVSPVLASESEIKNAILRHYKGQEPRLVSNKARKAVTREAKTTDGLAFELDVKPDAPTGGEVLQISQSQRNEQSFELDDAPPPPTSNKVQAVAPAPAPVAAVAPAGYTFTPEQVQKLEALRANQEKTGAIVRALTSLLTEKGYLR